MQPAALVIQCFVKLDTLIGLCDSLLRCDGLSALSLIFWLDHPTGSHREAAYTALHAEVSAYINDFAARHRGRFQAVEIHQNERNRGTCKTCQLALDYAFQTHPFVIFAEDDVIFSRDALLWFEAMRRQGVLDNPQVWAIAGESVFFNAEDRPLAPDWPEKMRALAMQHQLAGYITAHKFLPSTCFATSRENWAEFGSTRGQQTGDVDVNQRCATENRHAIFPVVPRVKDVGMLHEHGFSVLIHTAANVSEIKNTYVMAEEVLGDLDMATHRFKMLTNVNDKLYALSTKLQLPGSI